MIKAEDKVFDTLKQYTQLKDVLIKINPQFAQLNNSLLFNTVAQVTPFSKVAKIGKIYINELLLELNEAIGERESFLNYIKQETFKKKDKFIEMHRTASAKEKPDWLPNRNSDWEVLDVRNDETDPFLKLKEKADSLKTGEGFILIQKFEPFPIITFLNRNGFKSYTVEEDKEKFKIYFIKTGDNDG